MRKICIHYILRYNTRYCSMTYGVLVLLYSSTVSVHWTVTKFTAEGQSGEHFFEVWEIEESMFWSTHYQITRDFTSISEFSQTQFWGSSLYKNWCFISRLISSTTFEDCPQLFLVLPPILFCPPSSPILYTTFHTTSLQAMEESNSTEGQEDSGSVPGFAWQWKFPSFPARDPSKAKFKTT